MRLTDIPPKFSTPWGNNAGGSYIRTIPAASQIGITDGAASFADGFPPLNFTAIQVGGVPPFGQDMNGILNEITAWLRWMASGAPVLHDATFQSAIGGYPKDARVWSLVTDGLIWQSLIDNNTTSPDAGAPFWTVTTLVDPNIAALVLRGAGPAGAGIQMTGDGGLAPTKWIRSRGGVLEVVNNAYSAVITTIDDAGNLTAAGNLASSGGSVSAAFDVSAGRNLSGNLVTGNAVVQGGYVHSFGEVHADTNVTAAFDVNAQRNVSASGGITAGAIISAGANVDAGVDATAVRDVHAGRYLRAGQGARPQSDPAVACLLGDFDFQILPDPTTQVWHVVLPNKITLQGWTGNTATGDDIIPFPIAFPLYGLAVWVGEANPAGGWLLTNTPTLFAVQNPIFPTSFRLVTKAWTGAGWINAGGIAFRAIAIGY